MFSYSINFWSKTTEQSIFNCTMNISLSLSLNKFCFQNYKMSHTLVTNIHIKINLNTKYHRFILHYKLSWAVWTQVIKSNYLNFFFKNRLGSFSKWTTHALHRATIMSHTNINMLRIIKEYDPIVLTVYFLKHFFYI